MHPESYAELGYEIPLAFLRKGDRFRARIARTKYGPRIYRVGTAAMDGRMTSTTYGYRNPGNNDATRERMRRESESNVKANYVNVNWDDPETPYRTPYDWNHPNDTLYAADLTHAYVMVSAATFHRYLKDSRWEPGNDNKESTVTTTAKLGDRVQIVQTGTLVSTPSDGRVEFRPDGRTAAGARRPARFVKLDEITDILFSKITLTAGQMIESKTSKIRFVKLADGNLISLSAPNKVYGEADFYKSGDNFISTEYYNLLG